jgi:hypothetical protein
VADQQIIRAGIQKEKALSREQKFLENATGILLFIVVVPVILWFKNTDSPALNLFMLAVLFAFEALGLVQYFRDADYGDFVFQGAHFLVVLSIFWYFLTSPHENYTMLLFTTFCYRTDLLRHNSRNFAAVVSIFIPLAVLPVTLRWIRDDMFVMVLLTFYAVLVTTLWFSKLATWFREF